MEDNKVCKKCEKEKVLIEFGADKRAADGREGVCKECRRLARHKRAVTSMKKTVRAKNKKPKVVPVAEPLDPEKPIVDEIKLFGELIKKHNTHISITFHPHLDGCALQMKQPRFHKEGKNIEELINEALSLPSVTDVY